MTRPALAGLRPPASALYCYSGSRTTRRCLGSGSTSGHYQPAPGVIANPGYFRMVLDGADASGNFYWEVADFAAALCVRDGA